jgi:basic amino acid/polyamine antiporter, APA family
VPSASVDQAIAKRLSLWDSTSIIVGIIIGGGFYGSLPFIAANAGGAWQMLLAMALGGLLALAGALCYAELATTYPQQGGEYVYLTRALGRFWGFLYAWAGFWIIRPAASIAAMAILFGKHAHELLPITRNHDALIYGLACVLVLTGLNVAGVVFGKFTQNLLTIVKVVGLLAVFVAGIAALGASGPSAGVAATASGGKPVMDVLLQFGTAMILVMYAYGGWNEMPSVAAEVHNPERNILRAMVLGTVAVAAIYVVGTSVFLGALGFEGVSYRGGRPHVVAADLLLIRFPHWGPGFIGALIAISCLGAANGTIFTGSRVYYALGREHRLAAWLGRWNSDSGVPVRSLLCQGLVALAVVGGIGWQDDAFERLVNFTAPVFWVFLLLTVASLVILRTRDPAAQRPFRVPLYPVLPIVFCAACGFFIYASAKYAKDNMGPEVWIVAGVMAAGVVAAFVDGVMGRPESASEPQRSR